MPEVSPLLLYHSKLECLSKANPISCGQEEETALEVQYHEGLHLGRLQPCLLILD
jgi:hypothetical protein